MAKPVKKNAKPAQPKKEMKKRKASASFKSYISKILKQVHPQTRISKHSVVIINNFVVDTFDRVAFEAGKLCRLTKRSTLSSRDVQAAAKLVLPGELAKHAVSEGTKSLNKFRQ